jgi:hypothetical protein
MPMVFPVTPLVLSAVPVVPVAHHLLDVQPMCPPNHELALTMESATQKHDGLGKLKDCIPISVLAKRGKPRLDDSATSLDPPPSCGLGEANRIGTIRGGSVSMIVSRPAVTGRISLGMLFPPCCPPPPACPSLPSLPTASGLIDSK